MNARKIESVLAYFTLGFAALYLPIETFASWRYGLLNPFFLVDLIAIILLAAGVLLSLRARPRSNPVLLCAAYAWTGANAWRAAAARIFEVRKGGQLDHGTLELCVVTVSTVVILVCFALSLTLALRKRSKG